jgi:hypothetical protein
VQQAWPEPPQGAQRPLLAQLKPVAHGWVGSQNEPLGRQAFDEQE